QPALGNAVHAAALSLLLNDVAGLPLGSDQQHVVAAGNDACEELLRAENSAERLANVDDVDAVSLAVNERPHFGIPATGVMPEVNPRVQHLADQLRCQKSPPRAKP